MTGLDVRREALSEALRVDAGEWREALGDLDQFYAQFGGRVPAPVTSALGDTLRCLGG